MQYKKAFLVTTFCLIVVDQISKYVARYLLEGKGVYSYFNDMFRLVYDENHGAFLGLGSRLPESMRTLIFTILVSIFLLGFLIYVFREKSFTRMESIAGALIFSGGLSNLIDRLVNNGGVMDFLNLGIGTLRTGIFNIADMSIMLGAFLLILYSFNSSKESK